MSREDVALRRSLSKDIASWEETFKDHYLEEVTTSTDARVRVFYLRRPGTRIYLVQLSFTPEGIHLCGDAQFVNQRTNRGDLFIRRNLAWFLADMSAEYLAREAYRAHLIRVGAEAMLFVVYRRFRELYYKLYPHHDGPVAGSSS